MSPLRTIAEQKKYTCTFKWYVLKIAFVAMRGRARQISHNNLRRIEEKLIDLAAHRLERALAVMIFINTKKNNKDI